VIRARGAPDAARFWQGEEIEGKRVILRCLHGLGDAVQFLRFVPALGARVGHLTIEVPPWFFKIAPMFSGVEDVITWCDQPPGERPPWHVQMEVNELAYFFRTTEFDLPVAERYLVLPNETLEAVLPTSRRPTRLRVGVVWASGQWDTSRSLPLVSLKPLLIRQDCEFWNLQGGDKRVEWETIAGAENLHAAEECSNSVVHLAALIAQLDLIITPDTLAAHLAGALGKPAWVLLQYAADWRWQHGRSDSPWYPTLRLFRQQKEGGWDAVIDEVRQELDAWLMVWDHNG
jgi:ADP-heptose:LPS heptosyltransferase